MIRYFASHPTAGNILMFAVILLGLTALPKLQRDSFPVTPPTELEIRVPYSGASPADVEDAICLRIEEALDSVTELTELRCDARENVAIAVAQMREEGDMDEFFNDVKAQADAISDFPEKAEAPTVTKLERTAVVASIAVTGDTSPAILKAYANQIKNRIKRDRRIAQVRLLGFSDQDISIEIPAEALQRYGLGVSDISAALERQSIDLPSGSLETNDKELIVRFTEQRKSPMEFSDLIVVSGKSGGNIRLGDIATIRKTFDRNEEKILFNGKRAALLEISKTVTQDALGVMEAIQENLKRERQMAPKGVSLEISQNVTTNIRDRLRILLVNGGQGLVLVFLTMWLFFSFRYSFWVIMGLPVSFLGAVFAMQMLGYTINMITMVALLVAIGLLMDDAIVISENVAAQLKKGKKSLDAVADGVSQVIPGVLSSLATTVMVVGPLAFMAGKMGAVLKYLPVILVITLLVSLIEALLILPAHLRHSIDHMNKGSRSAFQRRFDTLFESLRYKVFGTFVGRAITKPYLTVGVLLTLVLIAFSAITGGQLKYRAFPELESDVIQARILLPQGTPLSQTEEVVGGLVAALQQLDDEFSQRQKGGKKLVKNISVLFNQNKDAYESGPHLATISADLLSAKYRVGTIDEMLNRWRTLSGDPPDVISLKFTDRERGVAGKAIDIRLSGNRLEQLKQASLELQGMLSKFKGVQDLSDDLRPGKPEIRIHLREEAGPLGISAKSVADELRAALHGGTRLKIQIGQEAYDITARLDPLDRNSIEDLRYLTIRSPNGQLVPLAAVAELEETRGFARINRVNGQRTVTVQGKLDTQVANARELMKMTQMRLLPELKEKYPGVRFSFQGQGKESATTGSSLTTNVLIGLIGVFLILAYQFRSYLQPLAVMLAIPTGLIGVVAGHLALGLDLSMPSLVGMASLTGIVVNDSILLVVFIKEKLQSGMTAVDAAKSAATDRFRAIILTSLTTIAGLLPLLLETSTQAQFLIPLVASLAFGLLTATILSLILVPAIFVIFDDLGFIRIEQKPEKEIVETT